MKKILKHLTIVFIIGLYSQSGYSQGTLLTPQGEMIRAAPMMLGKALPNSVSFAKNKANWIKLRDTYKMNAVRLCWIGPWYKDRNWANWSPQELMPHIARCVQIANETGMRVIINYHNVGEKDRPTVDYNRNHDLLMEFWRLVAQRFKNNDRVYFEITNEPTFNQKTYLHPTFKKNLMEVYRLVRNIAPNRELLMFSFNSTGYDIIEVVNAYKNQIDWSKTTIAFHGYADTSSNKVKQLRKQFRVMCTEWDYAGRYDYIVPIDGEQVNAQTWERLGISWADWRDWGDNSFDLIQNRLVPDAKEKGYWWGYGKRPSGVYRLRCLWGDRYLNVQGEDFAPVNLAPYRENWQSIQWNLEQVYGNTYRLKAVWRNRYYLFGNEKPWNEVKGAPLNPEWSAQQWVLERMSAGNVYRLRCLWGNNYLHGENEEFGSVQNAPLNPSWTSMQWALERVPNQNAMKTLGETITESSNILVKNPVAVGEKIAITFQNEQQSPETVVVFDSMGKLLFNGNMPIENENNRLELTTNELNIHTPGIYLLRFYDSSKGSQTIKIAIE